MGNANAFNASCTGCGVELEIPGEYAGQTIECPQCSTQFVATPNRQGPPKQQKMPAVGAQQKAGSGPAKSQSPGSLGALDGKKSRKSSLPPKRTYAALTTVIGVYNILAFVTLALGGLGIIFQAYQTINSGAPIWAGLIVIAMSSAGTALGFISFRAVAEFLKLMIDIQENTLTTARNSQR